MKTEIKKFLYDIQESINSIFEYIGKSKDFKEYQKNKLLRRAVEREFEIIGEAMNRILKIDKNLPVKHARRIVDLRNWVIHGYNKVDDVIVWGIITNDLPKLKAEVKKLLDIAK